jgi:hypothetical protein
VPGPESLSRIYALFCTLLDARKRDIRYGIPASLSFKPQAVCRDFGTDTMPAQCLVSASNPQAIGFPWRYQVIARPGRTTAAELSAGDPGKFVAARSSLVIRGVTVAAFGHRLMPLIESRVNPGKPARRHFQISLQLCQSATNRIMRCIVFPVGGRCFS